MAPQHVDPVRIRIPLRRHASRSVVLPFVSGLPQRQGKGLGAELILHAALVRGGPPSEGLDEQLFSEAGLRAHSAAWRLGVARGLIRDPGRVVTPST